MIVDKMQNLNKFTVQEQAVIDYIIKYPKDLLEMSVSELAEVSYTSASTIVRLCKKLGTKGYADLKFIYASEYPEMMMNQYILNATVLIFFITIKKILKCLLKWDLRYIACLLHSQEYFLMVMIRNRMKKD